TADGGDQVGADALRDEVGGERGLGVHRPGTAVGGHRHPAHRLDSAGEDQVLPTGADALRGLVYRFETRRAEAVQLHTGDRVGQARCECGGLGDVASLIADRAHAAEDEILDLLGVEPWVAVLDLAEQTGDEADRLHLVQRPGLLTATAWGANRIVDVRLGHDQPFGIGDAGAYAQALPKLLFSSARRKPVAQF